MNELDLPAAPPLPSDVRERALRTVLDGIDAPAVPARRAPFLAAAAAVVVAIALTTATAISGLGPDDPAGLDRLPPAAGVGGSEPTRDPTGDPFAGVELPPPSGDPSTDEALARCAAAVVHSGRAADYPPTSEWRSTLHMGTGAVEGDLVINDAFACLVTPASVAVSGTSGTPAGPVDVVRMSRGQLVVLNPEGLEFTIGPGDSGRLSEDPVTFVDIYEDETPAEMRLTVDGYDGPVPEPVQALTVVDRVLPERPDTPDGDELGACLDRLPTHVDADPRLWIPVGRHDVGGAAPEALVARIGDIAVGYCVADPGDGPTFTGVPLPPAPTGQAQPIAYYRGRSSALLLAVPPEVTRVEISSVPRLGAATAEAPCTIMDGLAMCTLAGEPPADPQSRAQVVVTTFTADSSTGTEVYRN